MHREHTGLGAKAHDDQEGDHQQAELRRARSRRDAAGGEGDAAQIVIEEEDAKQAKHRAEDGVDQVLDAGGNGLRRALMHDHRHGEQGHQLVEDIERDHGAGVALTDQRGEHGHVEELIAALVVVMAHVLQREHGAHQPHRAHEHREHGAEHVHAHIQRQRRGHIEQERLGALRRAQRNHHHELQRQRAAVKLGAQGAIFLRSRQQPHEHARQRREEDSENHQSSHGKFPP